VKDQIPFLVKFFKKDEHADQFLDGMLRLNRLSYFKQLEATGDGRSDHHEAVAAWLPRATIEFKEHPELNIRPEDLAAPVTLSFDHHDRLHVFCMTAMDAGDFECTDDGIVCTPDTVDALKKQLEVDARCLDFGPIAVMVRAREFVLRVRDAAKRLGYFFDSRSVQYFDPATFNGRFSLPMIPFSKVNAYSYQKEFRIVIDTGKPGGDPLTIDVGSLKDLAGKMPSAEVNKSFSIQTEPARQ
jgi:hypothetical protein